jgi:opacity protein-like surface antigen
MKTKVLLSLSAAALVNAAQLSAAPQISSGAYAGVAAGVSVLGGKSNYNHKATDDATGALVIQNTMNFSLSKTSMAATIFGGYGMKVSGFWVAGELFYQLDSLKDKQQPNIASDEKSIGSKSTGAYGLAVHLGFMPSENCMAYAILGLEARKFSVKFTDTPPATIAATINKKYTSLAFAPGVGARFALTKNISIRTEYKYAMHRSKTLTASAESPAAGFGRGNTDTVKIKHQPKVHTFNVGLVYTF